MTGPRRTTQLEAIKIHEQLKAIIQVVGDSFCEYQSPWDDSVVAEQLKVAKSSVQNIRRQIFGNLKSEENRINGKDVANRLQQIGEQYNNLTLCYKQHETAISNMEAELERLVRWARQRGYEAVNGRMHQK